MCSFFNLAWIHWDPPRFLFTIPIINRPVAWYGLFFVTGLIAGFFVLLPIFRRKLRQNRKLGERDVAGWSILASDIRTVIADESHPLNSVFVKALAKEERGKIAALKCFLEPNRELKNSILKALNDTLKGNFSREELETFFPKSLKSLSEQGFFLADKITWHVIVGTIIGARLGHVFFYEWPRYRENLLEIIKVWEGGLASHGGVIGIILALLFYRFAIRKTYPEFTLLFLLDSLVIPSSIAAVFIRIGNFFNQEIVGPVTNVPWAVIFAHPVETNQVMPRHPTQLYEAFAYFLIFLFLYSLWRKKNGQLYEGTMIGLFFVLCFGSRFFLEFFKHPSSLMFEESFLLTGQILSLPFILFGFYLLFFSRIRGKVLM